MDDSHGTANLDGKSGVTGPLIRKIGHELRNRLGVITNSLYFVNMKIGEADEEVQKHLQIMESQAFLASDIIMDLMDLAQPREPGPRPADFNLVVSSALEEVSPPSNVAVTVDVPADLPDLPLDSRQSQRSLQAVLTNAVEAMPEGGQLTIRARLQGETLRITIEDTGVGISPEHLPCLFDSLFTTKNKGFGLGLPLCRVYTENLGGIVEVASTEGKGTTVTLTWPVDEK